MLGYPYFWKPPCRVFFQNKFNCWAFRLCKISRNCSALSWSSDPSCRFPTDWKKCDDLDVGSFLSRKNLRSFWFDLVTRSNPWWVDNNWQKSSNSQNLFEIVMDFMVFHGSFLPFFCHFRKVVDLFCCCEISDEDLYIAKPCRSFHNGLSNGKPWTQIGWKYLFFSVDPPRDFQVCDEPELSSLAVHFPNARRRHRSMSLLNGGWVISWGWSLQLRRLDIDTQVVHTYYNTGM